jgi:hypothetical protein
MNQEQCAHLQEQLRTLQRRLRVLERQQATFGMHAPAHIELEIEDVHEQIAELEIALTAVDESPSIATASTRPSGRADYYAHIALPPNYIVRTEVLAAVRAALLAEGAPLALTSALTIAKPTALHGMGGIGKSVIARALCDDPTVQSAFPDGILWVTLGQTPDLIGGLGAWIQILGGAVSESAPTVDILKSSLAGLLADRACLLVVDDVWKRTEAEAFRVAGTHCRWLITTRDEAIADDLGANVHHIPVLNQAEAIALLDEWGEANLAGVEPTLKERIVARLGYLPLAVKLAGAQLRRKEPTAWLQTFDVRRLAARRPEDLHDSLELTFRLSLDTLRADDRPLYAALAIFKDVEAIPECSVARLWGSISGLDAQEATDLLDDLAARALLEVTLSNRGRSIHLHDLLRELIAADLDEATRVQLHRSLLDAYRPPEGAGWHTVPDDGYLYDHLVYHLEAIGAYEGLRALFANQRWMEVRVAQKDFTYDGYLTDLERAWSLAERVVEQQLTAMSTPITINDLLRFALIRTSINSLAANYTPALVARAVELGQWSAQRALSVAMLVPDATKKAELYGALLTTRKLDATAARIAQQRCWEALCLLGNDTLRMQLLAKVAPHLRPPLVDQALDFTLKATHAQARVAVLRAL